MAGCLTGLTAATSFRVVTTRFEAVRATVPAVEWGSFCVTIGKYSSVCDTAEEKGRETGMNDNSMQDKLHDMEERLKRIEHWIGKLKVSSPCL